MVPSQQESGMLTPLAANFSYSSLRLQLAQGDTHTEGSKQGNTLRTSLNLTLDLAKPLPTSVRAQVWR